MGGFIFVVIVKQDLGLLADTELFLSNDGTVAVDVGLDKIIKETTTLTNEHLKSSRSSIIFVI